MKESLSNMTSVSMSSSVYTKKYATELAKLCVDKKISNLDIVIGDSLESLNYTIFKQMSLSDANSVASMRACNLGRMFERIMIPRGVEVKVMLTSSLERSLDPDYVSYVYRCFYENSNFMRQVDRQIFENLWYRVDRLGVDVVRENIDDLRSYVIRELLILEGYHDVNYPTLEMYPGEIMDIRKMIWNGGIDLGKYWLNRSMSMYLDLSFLPSVKNRSTTLRAA